MSHHIEVVERVRSQVEALPGVAELFKALADATRCKILYALSLEELCVCDLADILGLSSQAVSYHLRLLRVARLVRGRKVGKEVFYRLDDRHVVGLLRQAVRHAKHR